MRERRIQSGDKSARDTACSPCYVVMPMTERSCSCARYYIL